MLCNTALRTGTSLRYKPGVIICGSGLVHDCGTSRAIGYFLEALVLLALFAKRVSGVSVVAGGPACAPGEWLGFGCVVAPARTECELSAGTTAKSDGSAMRLMQN